jgi:hypothetical protein
MNVGPTAAVKNGRVLQAFTNLVVGDRRLWHLMSLYVFLISIKVV